MDINKVIIPAAGLGTRFLPYSKSIPKEMLPLLNKPAIHYIVQEAFESGIKHLSLITNRSKHSIEDYFDTSPELLHILKDLGEKDLLNDLEKMIRSIDFTSIRQHEMMGLGHALWLARNSIGKEYCGVMLPDDIIFSKQPALIQLIRIARQEKASIIAVQEVPTDCLSSYGVVCIKKQITPHLFQISSVIEKPEQKDAPSNLAVIGRYILSHKIFNALDQMTTYSVGEELQLSDAINNMIQNNEKVFAYKVQGIRYDIGTPIGWIKAVIGSALQDAHYGPHIQRFINDLGTSESFIFNQSKNIQHTV